MGDDCLRGAGVCEVTKLVAELEQHLLQAQRYREHIRAMGPIRFHSIQILYRLSGLLGSAARFLGRMPSGASHE